MIASKKFLIFQLILLLSVLACANTSFAELGAVLQEAGGKPPAAQSDQGSSQRLEELAAQVQGLADKAKKAAQEASVAAERAGLFASIAEVSAQRAIEVRSSNPWYQNPGWWALLTPILLAIIAVVAFKERKRASIADAQRHALLRAIEINESFIRPQIPGPIALSLGIPENEVSTSFTKKVVLLLHHLVLLRQIYEQKDLLGIEAEQCHQQWASKVLRPWIDKDLDMVKIWGQLRQGDDLLGANFLKWVEPHIGSPTPVNPPLQPNVGEGTKSSSEQL